MFWRFSIGLRLLLRWVVWYIYVDEEPENPLLLSTYGED